MRQRKGRTAKLGLRKKESRGRVRVKTRVKFALPKNRQHTLEEPFVGVGRVGKTQEEQLQEGQQPEQQQ